MLVQVRWSAILGGLERAVARDPVVGGGAHRRALPQTTHKVIMSRTRGRIRVCVLMLVGATGWLADACVFNCTDTTLPCTANVVILNHTFEMGANNG